MTIEQACLEALDAIAAIETLDSELRQKRGALIELQKKIARTVVQHTETAYFEAAGRVWSITEEPLSHEKVVIPIDKSPAPELGQETLEEKEKAT